jgi:hypothetical protein
MYDELSYCESSTSGTDDTLNSAAFDTAQFYANAIKNANDSNQPGQLTADKPSTSSCFPLHLFCR